MSLVKITKKKYPVEIDLLYATKKNFTGKQIYKKKDCYLHKEAMSFFKKRHGYFIQITIFFFINLFTSKIFFFSVN